MGTEAICKIAVPVCPEDRSEDVLPQPPISPLRPVRSIFFIVDGRQIGKMWLLQIKRRERNLLANTWNRNANSETCCKKLTWNLLELPVAIMLNRSDLYNGREQAKWLIWKLKNLKKLSKKYTWLRYTKLKIGMNDFSIDVMLLSWPRFVYFAGILSVQFPQIHDDIFHARLFDTMCGRSNKMPWH